MEHDDPGLDHRQGNIRKPVKCKQSRLSSSVPTRVSWLLITVSCEILTLRGRWAKEGALEECMLKILLTSKNTQKTLFLRKRLDYAIP